MAEILKPGDKVNNYEIIKVLGQSEVASVYLARDEVQRRKWVVKEMVDPVEGEEELAYFKERFIEICRQLSGLKHKSIVQIIDYFVRDNNKFYIVREYLEGRTLKDFVENSSDMLTGGQVRIWSQQILELIDFLHRQKPPILMGVIVPKNLVISPMGKIRIMDLGLARFFPLDRQRKMLMKVSPGYSADEILNRNEEPSIRSDIYSVAAMFHYFLTGQDPNKNPFGFSDISSFREDISEKGQKAIMQALSRDPRDRFESIEEFKVALLGQSFRRVPTKIECNAKEIVVEDAPPGQLLPGSFHIKNVGSGNLEGIVFADYSWLKISPERFRANEIDIRFWIDTAYMEPEGVQENTVTIKTEDEKIEIPVKVSMAPMFPRSLGPVVASVLLFIIPLLLLVMVEALRIYQIDKAWELLLLEYGHISRGIQFVIEHKSFLLDKMPFDSMTTLAGRLYGFCMILMPYLVPMLAGKFRNMLRPDNRKAVTIPAVIAMMLPTIMLFVSMNLSLVKDNILVNPALKYLDPARYLWFVIPINIVIAVLMLIPRDDQDHSFIDNSPFLRILSFTLLIIYYVVAIILRVLM